jgi:hypothetical protein
MLRIRRNQMLAFIHSDKAFAEWFVDDYLREEMPELFDIREDDLEEMMLNGRRYAESFGLDDVESQAHFVILMYTTGPNFFQFDGFAQILGRRDLPPMERIEAIYSRVTDEQAEHALSNADSRYWYPDPLEPEDQ